LDRVSPFMVGLGTTPLRHQRPTVTLMLFNALGVAGDDVRGAP
jgi:hypothetical protein